MLVQTPLADTVVQIRDRIAAMLGAQKFKVWFKNSTKLTYSDGILKVGVANLFIGSWIENHYADVIAQAAKEVLGMDVQVTFAIDPVLFRGMRKTQLNSQAAFIEKNSDRLIRGHRNGNGNGHGNGHDDGNGHGRGDNNGDGAGDAPAFSAPRKLRGRLDNFVVGAHNRLAYSLAQSVVDNPNGDYGHLFFHGPCGLGKTHLLQGITNALTEKRPEARWLYSTGEDFTNQFLMALRTKRIDAFRHRFRELDVLLLDDVHFFSNKRATQDEFLHTFNTIHDAGMRIVMASDAHPKMIGDLPETLVNRMVAGMVVRIEPPDFETRCELLRRRAAATRQAVPEPVIAYIAERIKTNVRELEGCLLKLVAYTSLLNQPITLALARQALEDHLNQTRKILTVSDIESSVATYFGLTPADLHTSRKSKTVALARNLAMYLARKHTGLSFPEIGRLMGNKDHTTVLLACRRLNNVLEQSGAVTWLSAAGPQTAPLRELLTKQEEQLVR